VLDLDTKDLDHDGQSKKRAVDHFDRISLEVHFSVEDRAPDRAGLFLLEA
jgi:hypothetical protein